MTSISRFAVTSVLALTSVAVADNPFGTGDGSDGAGVISGPNTVVNVYQPLGALVVPGTASVTVPDTTGFGTGDLVMVWQTQAELGLTAGDKTPIDLVGSVVGQWEIAQVLGATGSILFIDPPLRNAYDPAGAQVVRVPQYTTLDVQPGAAIVAPGWDGAVGGIIAITATSLVTVDGSIDAQGLGFHPGTSASGWERGVGGVAEGIDRSPGYNMTSTANRSTGGPGGVNGTRYENWPNSGGKGGGNGAAAGAARVLGAVADFLTLGGGGGASGPGYYSRVSRPGGRGGGVVWLEAGALTGSGALIAMGSNGVDGTSNDSGGGGGGAGGTLSLVVLGAADCGPGSSVTGGAGGGTSIWYGAGSWGGGGRAAVVDDGTGTCHQSISCSSCIFDSDGDGLSDSDEINVYGSDRLDRDSDDDGIIDGDEAYGTGPLSAYGPTDPANPDSDGDLLPDGLELGLVEADVLAESDTDLTLFIGDGDAGATVTDPTIVDSDGDGLADGLEDLNANGVFDGDQPGTANDETDPNAYDTDADGISDLFEGGPGGRDTDADGIIDALDYCVAPDEDLDLDGICDSLDFCFGDNASGDADADGTCADQDCDDNDALRYVGAPERCNGLDDDCDGATPADESDGDLDGWMVCEGDCDDASASTYPNASELCDGADNDCDGVLPTTEDDLDADTWMLCEGDCDDASAGTYPGASELCDGADNNCDGAIPSNEQDSDADGWMPCAGDCADGDPLIYPNAAERCNGLDDDCDGATPTDEADADNDTVRVCAGDCDDAVATTSPLASEVCDQVDNDCDGVVDNGVTTTFYRDQDADGYGDPTATSEACSLPSGYLSDNTDCDDTRAQDNPAASEVCDQRDNDCDGMIDAADPDNTGWFSYYLDADTDGFGDPNQLQLACELPSGYVTDNTDCNDQNTSAHPQASELPDGVDQDCDGQVDEGTERRDDDGDGYAELAGDCDDADPARSPAAVEVCDGVDQDCDGRVDQGTDCFDDDGDGLSEQAGDCNDGDPAVAPGLVEIADNGVDDDCDGQVDSGTNDPDGDGYVLGDCGPHQADQYPNAPELADGIDNDCDGVIDNGTTVFDDDGDGYAENAGDCDDANPAIHPGAAELPNGVDDDCDGEIDYPEAWMDRDRDGLAEALGDCNDDDSSVHPGAEERPNNIDDDCDGEVDEGLDDRDQDGVSAPEDCNDDNGWQRPGLDETCDGVDNNCDGVVDEGCWKGPVTVTVDTGGCSHTGGTGPGGVMIGLLALVAVRRRQRAVSSSTDEAS